MKARKGLMVAALAVVVGVAGPALSAPGDKDSGFGRRGVVVTDVDMRSNDRCFELALQHDGRIVCVGITVPRGSQAEDVVLARYLRDGRPDPTFGSRGIVRFDSGLSQDDVASSGVIQADGKIVVAGVSDVPGGQDFLVARFRADGSLDETFGKRGFVTTDVGDAAQDVDYGFAVALQRDRKIVVAGQTSTGDDIDVAVARYTSDGALDASFGTGGKVRIDLGGVDTAYALAVLPGGKVLIGAAGGRRNEDFGLVRLLPSGRLDRTFGVRGLSRSDVGIGYADLRAVVPLRTGKFIAVGEGFDDGGAHYAVLVGYRPDGRIDPSFGRRGRLLLNVATMGTQVGTFAAAALPSGKFVVAGGTGGRIFVSRHLPDGRYDPSFGGSGLVATRIGSGAGWASAVAVQRDADVVAAGTWARAVNRDTDLAVLRFRGRGSHGTTITSLRAERTGDGAVVRWRTSSEANTARFELYRQQRTRLRTGTTRGGTRGPRTGSSK
jgi:uncharacterized delta-60 repeat protein